MESVEKEIKFLPSQEVPYGRKETVARSVKVNAVVDLRYINDVLITGYCVWVEPVSRERKRGNLKAIYWGIYTVVT